MCQGTLVAQSSLVQAYSQPNIVQPSSYPIQVQPNSAQFSSSYPSEALQPTFVFLFLGLLVLVQHHSGEFPISSLKLPMPSSGIFSRASQHPSPIVFRHLLPDFPASHQTSFRRTSSIFFDELLPLSGQLLVTVCHHPTSFTIFQ